MNAFLMLLMKKMQVCLKKLMRRKFKPFIAAYSSFEAVLGSQLRSISTKIFVDSVLNRFALKQAGVFATRLTHWIEPC